MNEFQQPIRLQILPRDWHQPGWNNIFYPDDMPVDWQLSFFANEFPGVLVPAEVVLNLCRDDVDPWVDEVADGFKFYLECSEAGQLPSILSCAKRQGDGFAGIVTMDADIQAQAISARVKAFLGCTVLEMQSDPKVPVAALLDVDELGTLRNQRALLEQLMSKFPEGADLPVFLCGNEMPIDKLRQLRQLAELMNLA